MKKNSQRLRFNIPKAIDRMKGAYDVNSEAVKFNLKSNNQNWKGTEKLRVVYFNRLSSFAGNHNDELLLHENSHFQTLSGHTKILWPTRSKGIAMAFRKRFSQLSNWGSTKEKMAVFHKLLNGVYWRTVSIIQEVGFRFTGILKRRCSIVTSIGSRITNCNLAPSNISLLILTSRSLIFVREGKCVYDEFLICVTCISLVWVNDSINVKFWSITCCSIRNEVLLVPLCQ